jgi:hypothetical protein
MTSQRQIEANRRNARKSTGPITEEGKQRSRCNAVRHGLTAETVIGALEDAEDYKAFEAAIIADYDAQSAVERELVLRLASLLWRLRRATTMETGLFEIQADYLRELRQRRQTQSQPPEIIAARFGWTDSVDVDPDRVSHGTTNGKEARPGSGPKSVDPATELARCFLTNLPTYPLDRLSRYEATLWRQAGQILFALDTLDRRKPRDRRPRFRIGTGINCHPTSAMNADFRARPSPHCSTRNGNAFFSTWRPLGKQASPKGVAIRPSLHLSAVHANFGLWGKSGESRRHP